MKLNIKKEFFDKIKSGEKKIEFRDAHITFVCEETGETLVKEVDKVLVKRRVCMPDVIKDLDIFTDDWQMWFYLGDKK